MSVNRSGQLRTMIRRASLKRCCRILLWVVPVFVPCVQLFAGGLVCAVPSDGTSVTYELRQTGSAVFNGKEHLVSGEGSVRLAFVGTSEVAGLQCRWLEIEENVTYADGRKVFGLSKLLIPEKELESGKDPLAMAFRIYSTGSKDNEPHLIASRKDRSYRIDQLRRFIPKAATPLNRLNKLLQSQTVRTGFGNFTCRCHVFDYFNDRYAPNGPHRTQEYGVYKVWHHDSSPLGVVAMDIHSALQGAGVPLNNFESDEFKVERATSSTVTRLRKSRIDRDVVSRFPNCE